jgi:hypothetical protein
MSNKIFKGYTDELDATKINIADMKELETKSKLAYVSYGEQNTPLIIQTPLLFVPYPFGGSFNGKLIHALSLSFGDYKTNDKLKKFYENMNNIDNFIKNHAIKNYKSWFPKLEGKSEDYIKDAINTNYQPIIKHTIDKETKKISEKYPPIFKVKIQYDEETSKYIKIDLSDLNDPGLSYDFNEMKEKMVKSNMKVLFRITSIWLVPATGMFGVTAKASMLKVGFPNDVKDVWRSDSEDEEEGQIKNKMEEISLMKEVEEEILEAKMKDLKNVIKDSEDEEEENKDEDEDEDDLSSSVVVEEKDSDNEDDDDDDDEEEEIKPKSKSKKDEEVKSKKKPVKKKTSK